MPGVDKHAALMNFLRYVGVQLVAYGIDMGSYLLLLVVGNLAPLWANLCSKICAGLFAFYVHRVFTFRLTQQQQEHSQIVRYFLLLALNIPLSSLLLALLLLAFPSAVLAKFVADVLCVFLTFWLSKRYVFTRLQAGQPAETKQESGL